MTQVNININQVTRIEGHGNILLNASDGKIEKLLWEVSESPRLFEAMLRGRNWEDVPIIASRICGICSISHTTASLQAVEDAFGIKPSAQTLILRKLAYDAEMLESHVLHAYFLVAPDFVGVGSVFPMIATHKDAVVRAVKLKRLAYRFAEALVGRKTHPLSCTVGGFAKMPDLKVLKGIRAELNDAYADMDATVTLFQALKPRIPDFTRQTEYIALKNPSEYAFISGDIASSDTPITPLHDYKSVTNEFCVPTSTAKYTKHARDSYMVGALARFNLNHDQLLPRARQAAAALGLKAPCHNPFMITVAQVVETVHVIEEAIGLIDQLLDRGVAEEPNVVKPRESRGVAGVEAPRGILFHDYTFDKNGICTSANCIIPTNQNHNSIQKDFEALVPKIIGQPQDKIALTLEMLVRAYDPCISCSTHMLKVNFK